MYFLGKAELEIAKKSIKKLINCIIFHSVLIQNFGNAKIQSNFKEKKI